MCFSFICHCQKIWIFFKKKKKMKAFFWCVFVFDHGTWSGDIRLKDVQQNKKQIYLNWAVLSNIFSRLHAAVIVYFGAPAWANTVSDRDWCKINTSQECDVLINSLCCSDRKARHVRGGLQRRPLWSCQVEPSKADEAVRLLICLYWQAPSPPLKPFPLSMSLKKYARLQRQRPRGWMQGQRPNTFWKQILFLLQPVFIAVAPLLCGGHSAET